MQYKHVYTSISNHTNHPHSSKCSQVVIKMFGCLLQAVHQQEYKLTTTLHTADSMSSRNTLIALGSFGFSGSLRRATSMPSHTVSWLYLRPTMRVCITPTRCLHSSILCDPSNSRSGYSTSAAGTLTFILSSDTAMWAPFAGMELTVVQWQLWVQTIAGASWVSTPQMPKCAEHSTSKLGFTVVVGRMPGPTLSPCPLLITHSKGSASLYPFLWKEIVPPSPSAIVKASPLLLLFLRCGTKNPLQLVVLVQGASSSALPDMEPFTNSDPPEGTADSKHSSTTQGISTSQELEGNGSDLILYADVIFSVSFCFFPFFDKSDPDVSLIRSRELNNVSWVLLRFVPHRRHISVTVQTYVIKVSQSSLNLGILHISLKLKVSRGSKGGKEWLERLRMNAKQAKSKREISQLTNMVVDSWICALNAFPADRALHPIPSTCFFICSINFGETNLNFCTAACLHNVRGYTHQLMLLNSYCPLHQPTKPWYKTLANKTHHTTKMCCILWWTKNWFSEIAASRMVV